MIQDIRFYDLDFNLLYILPPCRNNIGYVSINTTQEYNDSGDLEIVFSDEKLKAVIEEYRDNLMVIWSDFQGFLTSYRWTDKECRLFGMHLNGLLHRAVIGVTAESTATVKAIADKALGTIGWLSQKYTDAVPASVTYGTKKPERADDFLQNLFKAGNCGYSISADIPNKQYVFTIFARNNNPLMLSVANLNAYGIEITYINKELAHTGWYKVNDTWQSVSDGSGKSDIHNIATVLDAETSAEATNELKECKAKYEVVATTRNVSCGIDYNIGDIVRVQSGSITKRQLVAGIKRWQENGYGEQPILTDYEEE